MTPEDAERLVVTFDDPGVVAAMIELSHTRPAAMCFVRWALAYHVERWCRLRGRSAIIESPEPRAAGCRRIIAPRADPPLR